MPHKVGDRVGAILSQNEKEIRFLGYGVYAGDLPCPYIGGRPNPRIDLDSGDHVWGCQCWWGDATDVAVFVNKAFAKGVVVINEKIQHPQPEDLSKFDGRTDADRPERDSQFRYEGKMWEVKSIHWVVTDEYGNMPEMIKPLVSQICSDGQQEVIAKKHATYKQVLWILGCIEVFPMPTPEQTKSSLEEMKELLGE